MIKVVLFILHNCRIKRVATEEPSKVLFNVLEILRDGVKCASGDVGVPAQGFDTVPQDTTHAGHVAETALLLDRVVINPLFTAHVLKAKRKWSCCHGVVAIAKSVRHVYALVKHLTETFIPNTRRTKRDAVNAHVLEVVLELHGR